MWAKAWSVPRTFLQVLSASIGKRTLLSLAAAIPLLAAVVILVGTSVTDDLREDELIDALPVSPPAAASDVQAVHFALTSVPPVSDAALTTAPPPSDAPGASTPRASAAEALVETSGAAWELIPSPRPRPALKVRQRRAHNIRNLSSDKVAILPPASIVAVQSVRPRVALMGLPPASHAETLTQGSAAFPERDAQSSAVSWEASALPPRSMGGATEVQPVRPLAALTETPPASDTANLVQTSATSSELVPAPRPRPVHKSRARRVHKMRNLPNRVSVSKPMTILEDLRDQSAIDRVVKDHPSNVALLLLAEMRRESQETGRLVEKLFDEIEPPALAQETNYANASRVQLEAYRLDLKAAGANALAVMPRYEAALESEREKVEVVVQLLNMDDWYRRTALSKIDKQLAQRIDLTSKMLSANAELYRAIGAYVEILLEQFGRYQVSTNGHLVFSSQSGAGRYIDASREINDALKRVAELEEERKNLVEFQQEEWERFASGK